MQKNLLALLVIAIPALLIYGLVVYLPQFLTNKQYEKDAILNQEFKSIDTPATKKYVDKEEVKDYFYQNLKIDENVSKNTQFYSVKADTPWELREKILEEAPTNLTTDKKSIVKVTYSVDWTLSTTQLEGECKFTGAKVNTTITMLLPLWDGLDKQDPQVQEEWHKYLDNVVKYEEKHNKLLEKASHDLAYKIKFIPKQALCDDLIEKVNSLGAKNIETTKVKVGRYKSETGAGKMLGVQLPDFTPSEIYSN